MTASSIFVSGDIDMMAIMNKAMPVLSFKNAVSSWMWEKRRAGLSGTYEAPGSLKEYHGMVTSGVEYVTNQRDLGCQGQE